MIAIYSLSPLKSRCLLEETLPLTDDVVLSVKYNNTTVGLCEYYNSIIENEENDKYDAVICCHHDISLRYANFQTGVTDALKLYDVVGVAGGRAPKVIEKNLWHWMTSREEYRGIAAHGDSIHNMFVTNFGATPSRVTVLDGVFLAFNTRKIRKTKARFDEKFMWHHYDIDFSLTCNENKLKLGVWPILIYHQSPGLRDMNNEHWNKSNEYFRNKWS